MLAGFAFLTSVIFQFPSAQTPTIVKQALDLGDYVTLSASALAILAGTIMLVKSRETRGKIDGAVSIRN
jgi:hypothetical protein